MSDSKSNTDRVLDLAGAICNDVASQGDLAELDSMMLADYASRYEYMDYCRVHVALALELRADQATRNVHRQIDVESAARGPDLAVPPTAVPVHLLDGAIHGTIGDLASGWLVAYLIATVVLAIGLAIGAVTHVSQPMQLVQDVPAPSSPVSIPQSIVGRITGMVDCRFAANSKAEDPSPKSKIRNLKSETISKSRNLQISKSLVSLGDRFKLASGLLEITYDTGARVIVQGPAAYEVESPSSGYLAIGKLTARVENAKPQAASLKSEISNPQSPIPNPSLSTLHSPLFTVRTPTATVTDLGTEFGIAVSKEGQTEVHVIQGVVETRSIDVRGMLSPARRVTEGLAVAVGLKTAGIEAVAFAPQSFTRIVRPPTDTPAETAYISAVLADGPMGYWPLNEPAGARKFADRSGNGLVGYAMNKVAAGQPGPLGAGSHASDFHGHDYIDLGQHNQFAMPNNFTVEAWVWIDEAAESSYVFSAIGREGNAGVGWGLAASRQTTGSTDKTPTPPILSFVVQQAKHFDFPLPSGESIKNRWLHLALTFDAANTARLYVNGKLQRSVTGEKSAVTGPVWLNIGCAEPIEADFWRGRLAHIAVYPRALDARHIQKHFDQCPRGGKEAPGKHP
jgi:hypothetical protein